SLNRQLSALKITNRSAIKTEIRKKEKAVENGVRRKEIRRIMTLLKNAEKVDLAFMVDCTGSMSSYIKAVKDQIGAIVERVKSTNPSLNLRLAFLGYRDLCDGEKQFEKADFSDELGHQVAFKSFISDVRAFGGGDNPEDIAGALKHILEFSWAFPTKILFHIADAPCHGTNYHSYSRDDHPDGGPDGPFIQQYLASLDKQGVQYFFARISPSTDKMIEQFNAGMGKAYITTVPLESASKLVGTVTTSIRKSIHTSMVGITGGATTVRYGARSKSFSMKKNYLLTASTPSWSSMPAQKVTVFSNQAPKSTEDLKNPSFGLRIFRLIPLVNGTKHYEKHIKIAPQPFAEGAIRLAYKGQLQLTAGRVRDVILKEFKVAVAEAHSMQKYMAQIEVSSVASFLAEEYNKQKEPHLKKVRVLKSRVVKAEHP
ncbi:unnamed protein product, partial [Heterosigma akashiwo]